MPRGIEPELSVVMESGNGAIVLASIASAGKKRIELSDNLRVVPQCRRLPAQHLCQSGQDARNFGSLVVGKLHELVVQFDGHQGLDKNGLSRGARTVNDGVANIGIAPLGG